MADFDADVREIIRKKLAGYLRTPGAARLRPDMVSFMVMDALAEAGLKVLKAGDNAEFLSGVQEGLERCQRSCNLPVFGEVATEFQRRWERAEQEIERARLTDAESDDDEDEPEGSERMANYYAMLGVDAIKAAVDEFYRRVLADPRVQHYFVGVDMARLKRHQVAMMSHALGGPEYTGPRSMNEAHAHLKVTNEHYDIVGEHLSATLTDAGVPMEAVKHVEYVLETLRGEIVTG